jgi:hypothetical protein
VRFRDPTAAVRWQDRGTRVTNGHLSGLVVDANPENPRRRYPTYPAPIVPFYSFGPWIEMQADTLNALVPGYTQTFSDGERERLDITNV